MITLASDFGSPYPAAMKGVILQRTDARLVDIAHDFPRQDVRTAAFWLREILPYFPPAVHLAVVDPGVGTDRAVLAIRSGDHVLVGPDNGLLVPAARQIADEIRVYDVTFDTPDSTTFHGRDVFAPVAADVHEAGLELLDRDDRFTETTDYESISFPEPTVEAGQTVGSVLVIDGFGNVITNVPGTVITDHFGDSVVVDGDRVPVRQTYAAVPAGERLVTVGSHGYVELAVNRGRGDDAFDVNRDETVRIVM